MLRKRSLASTESVDETCKQVKEVLQEKTEKACGRQKKKKPTTRGEWWWKQEAQNEINKKKEAFKMWQRNNSRESHNNYKALTDVAKRAVARARALSPGQWYQELNSKEGEQKIYRTAKARDRAKRDLETQLSSKVPRPATNNR